MRAFWQQHLNGKGSVWLLESWWVGGEGAVYLLQRRGPGIGVPVESHLNIMHFKHDFIPGQQTGSEKAMVTHSSTLAWRIPWTEEPGRLQSMGSLRVRHDWVNSLSLFTFMHWRRKWQPTPVFLPGESHGQRSLLGCHLWGHTESDTTDVA